MCDLESSRAMRGDAKPGRTECPEVVIGRDYKGAGGGKMLPMYDVVHRKS